MSTIEPDFEQDELRPRPPARRSARVSAIIAAYLALTFMIILAGGTIGVAVRFFRLVAGL